MPSIVELISICKTAIEGGQQVFDKLRATRLTNEQIDLLAHAQKSGTFHVIEIDQCPIPLVKAGDSAFAGPEDLPACARYYEGLRQLCQRGFVEHRSGNLFTLTSAGFAKARKLSAPKPGREKRGPTSRPRTYRDVAGPMLRPETESDDPDCL